MNAATLVDAVVTVEDVVVAEAEEAEAAPVDTEAVVVAAETVEAAPGGKCNHLNFSIDHFTRAIFYNLCSSF